MKLILHNVNLDCIRKRFASYVRQEKSDAYSKCMLPWTSNMLRNIGKNKLLFQGKSCSKEQMKKQMLHNNNFFHIYSKQQSSGGCNCKHFLHPIWILLFEVFFLNAETSGPAPFLDVLKLKLGMCNFWYRDNFITVPCKIIVNLMYSLNLS